MMIGQDNRRKHEDNTNIKRKRWQNMDVRKLYNSMPYTGMKKCARMILDSDKKYTDKELATMTDYEICEKLLENYEVVSISGIGSEHITLVKKEDMKLYSSITKELSR